MKIKFFHRLLLLSLVFVAFSCKKDSNSTSSGSDSYVKIKMNGNWITYKGLGELGPDLDDNTKIDLTISGASTDNKDNFSISIQLDGNNFPTGTYSSDETQYWMPIDFMTDTGSSLKDYDISDAMGMDPSKYTVNITSITSSEIKGTFTGNYLFSSFNDTDPDGGIVYITEGEFKVKRIR